MVILKLINNLGYYNTHKKDLFTKIGRVILICDQVVFGSKNETLSFSKTRIRFREIASLLRLLHSLRYDVVVSHTPLMNLRLALLRRKRCIYAFNGLGFVESSFLLRNIYLLLFRGLTFMQSPLIVVQNFDDRQRFQRYGFRGVVVIRGSGFRGLSTGKITKNNGKIRVIGVGRILEDKGVYEFCETARLLSGKAEFIWVGDSDNNPKKINFQNLKSKYLDFVRFTGYQSRDDVLDLVRNSDVFLLPSYHEGCSHAAVQAAYFGLPLVMPDVVGCREQILDGYNGFLTKKGCVRSNVEALQKLIDSRGRLEEMSMNSIEFYNANWTISSIRDEWKEVINSVIASTAEDSFSRRHGANTPRN